MWPVGGLEFGGGESIEKVTTHADSHCTEGREREGRVGESGFEKAGQPT